MVQNKALIFNSIPDRFPVPGKDIVVQTREFDPNQSPPKGGITTKNYFASFDPYMRGRMRSAEIKSYAPAFTLGQPLDTRSIAKVLKSGSSKFQPGDLIHGMLSMEEYSAIDGERLETCSKIDNPFGLDPRYFIGALGMPGLTAYASLYAIGVPKKGETIFISAASGAVGQIVGQLAKHEGLTVFGSVGSDEKLDYIMNELGFDGGFNYKKEKPDEALSRLVEGKGIDIYYDNVGGEQLDATLPLMNNFGRIVGSGMISQYNKRPDERYGVKNLMMIVAKRLKFEGFIASDSQMGPAYFDAHQKAVQKWLHEGSFKAAMSETNGIDRSAEGFVGMLKGENFGKAVLKIAELD